DFLEELKWHEDTHQICFCTLKSLLSLRRPDRKQVSLLSHIGEPIVEKLVTDFGFDELIAAEKFFSSDTFTQLANESTELYKKSWQEIYEMLKKELSIK
ncbi:MAG: hypothetical protein FWG49_08050, partial [Leptospirales bacterium]|nr:hypothetical protein [Leptospirales bacterium]